MSEVILPTQEEMSAALVAMGLSPDTDLDAADLTASQINQIVQWVFAWDDARQSKVSK